MSMGGGVLHFYPHFPVKLLCVLGGGGVCFVITIFPNSSSCVCGGGGAALLHFYETFAWMCSNVGPQHDMPNQTSDFILYTHSCSEAPAASARVFPLLWDHRGPRRMVEGDCSALGPPRPLPHGPRGLPFFGTAEAPTTWARGPPPLWDYRGARRMRKGDQLCV